jgi:hypothetical protein
MLSVKNLPNRIINVAQFITFKEYEKNDQILALPHI